MVTRSPLTNSQDITLVKAVKSEQLILDWKSFFDIDITNELHNYQEIYLYECNKSKLRFFVPNLVGSNSIYKNLQKFNWYYMPTKWEYNIALNDLKTCLNVLEIGSGFGHFIKLAKESGLNIRGIELNQTAVEVAQENQLPVENTNLQDLAELYPESFDAVCSFQVLEHVPNPKEFVSCSLQLLKPNGKLIIAVPNAQSFLKHQYNLLDMPPHHVTQWSSLSFKYLEKIFPIELEKILKEPLASYHVGGYVDAYSNYWLSVSPLTKLLFNRYTTLIYQKILNTRIRNLVTGQSLYVKFQKIL